MEEQSENMLQALGEVVDFLIGRQFRELSQRLDAIDNRINDLMDNQEEIIGGLKVAIVEVEKIKDLLKNSPR